MKCYDPYALVISEVADALEAATKTDVFSSDISEIDVVARYDLSGNPTKPGVTANKIIVRPDRQMGTNRGFYDTGGAIGFGPRTWVYHVEVLLETFPIRTTKDKEEVRDIISKLAGRVIEALHELQRSPSGNRTEDGRWVIMMGSTPFIQGAGTMVKDAGPNRSIKAEQRLIVGWVLQYLGG